MDRYGEAIEYDLLTLGLDLLDFFRGKHSWRRLLVILNGLPRTSRFRQAQADDEEYAEALLDLPEVSGPATVPLSDFSPEYEMLTLTVELLQSVNGNLIALGHGKPPRVQPMPRPRTALDRIKDRRRLARFDDLVAEVEAAQERWESRKNAG